jgi:hypothetical protein
MLHSPLMFQRNMLPPSSGLKGKSSKNQLEAGSKESAFWLLAWFTLQLVEATCSPKMLVDFQQTTWCYIPEDRVLFNHPC